MQLFTLAYGLCFTERNCLPCLYLVQSELTFLPLPVCCPSLSPLCESKRLIKFVEKHGLFCGIFCFASTNPATLNRGFVLSRGQVVIKISHPRFKHQRSMCLRQRGCSPVQQPASETSDFDILSSAIACVQPQPASAETPKLPMKQHPTFFQEQF